MLIWQFVVVIDGIKILHYSKQTMYGHLKKWKIILPNIMKKILMVHGWTINMGKDTGYILQVQYILFKDIILNYMKY